MQVEKQYNFLTFYLKKIAFKFVLFSSSQSLSSSSFERSLVANWPVIEKALSASTEVGGIHFGALINFLNKRGMSDWMPHWAYESQRFSIKLGSSQVKFLTFQTWLDLKFSSSSSFKLENLKLIIVKLDLTWTWNFKFKFKFSGFQGPCWTL